MASSPWIHTNPKLRPVKLKSSRLIIAERLGQQHYLIWDKGSPLTEVQCIPENASRWYWRGSGMNWTTTRSDAIQKGILRNIKGARIDGRPMDAWSPAALAAMQSNAELTGAPSAKGGTHDDR